jgi:hypothetical protein
MRSSWCCLFLLLEPLVADLLSALAAATATLNIDGLRLVRLQVVGEVCFFGRLGGGWDGEFLYPLLN